MTAEIEDYTKALEVVKTYSTQDGLDVDTLLDSDKHGALTYNDFLLLPGYIGKPDIRGFGEAHVLMMPFNRLPCLRCQPGYPCYQAHHPEGPPSVLPHGHCH